MKASIFSGNEVLPHELLARSGFTLLGKHPSVDFFFQVRKKTFQSFGHQTFPASSPLPLTFFFFSFRLPRSPLICFKGFK